MNTKITNQETCPQSASQTGPEMSASDTPYQQTQMAEHQGKLERKSIACGESVECRANDQAHRPVGEETLSLNETKELSNEPNQRQENDGFGAATCSGLEVRPRLGLEDAPFGCDWYQSGNPPKEYLRVNMKIKDFESLRNYNPI